MSKNHHYTSISTLGTLVREQKISPVEIVDECLQRIEQFNPTLNAFITILKDESRKQAKIAEAEIKAGKWRGPLHGIPVGIKDFYDTAGVKTTAAFEHFKNRVPKKDAEGVSRLKHAGAIVIGKMNMHQLGMGTTGLESFFGSVNNPWKSGYIPGGSSAGSAAAVASGLCYATLDTDAIGSCRLPAACCGVVGFKGTYNLISAQGILEGEQPPDDFIKWMSHVGITTRYVEDTAIVLNVLANGSDFHKVADIYDALKKNTNLRIGIASNFKADTEVMKAFEKAVESIQNLGYDMQQVDAPFADLNRGIANIEADRKGISEKTFSDIDVIILPTTATPVPKAAEVKSNPQGLSPEFTAFANYYGLPAISVPCGFDKNKLPLGLQFLGKPGEDARVLQTAYSYQELGKYKDAHPFE
jgi:aspartyl-tRNA(Asn)/glutamyl-tRNA(Gln) amidotransferase subunit A